jgi:hypothetical protein
MLFRAVSWGLIFAGVALLALAGYAYFTEPPPVPALLVPQTDIELSDCRAGEEKAFSIPLQNNSRRPIKIVGLAWC